MNGFVFASCKDPSLEIGTFDLVYILFMDWALLTQGCRLDHSLSLKQLIILTRSLTNVGAPVEAAEGIVETVHVRLAHTPAVRHPTCDTRVLIGQSHTMEPSDWMTLT